VAAGPTIVLRTPHASEGDGMEIETKTAEDLVDAVFEVRWLVGRPA
jgi:hypothetical protein